MRLNKLQFSLILILMLVFSWFPLKAESCNINYITKSKNIVHFKINGIESKIEKGK